MAGVSDLTVACVRTGTKYAADYVHRLKAMTARHLRSHRFVCLTDRPGELPELETVNVAALGLPGWWAKMALFSPRFRGGGRVLYFDLDTVICGPLGPLADWDGTFGICANFAVRAGHPTWPCRYGSAVMSFAPGWGEEVWDAFARAGTGMIAECPKGDQQAIEALVPDATLLQDVMPPGFFTSYRELGEEPLEAASVICFGGHRTPANCPYGWVRRHWRDAA